MHTPLALTPSGRSARRPSPRRLISRAAGMLAAASVLALLSASAQAGPPGRWTQITRAHNGAKSNLGLARGKDGTLHVLWAGPTRGPFTAIYDTPVSRAGVVGQQRAVVSGWNSVQPPAAAAAPDGSIHVLISGQKVLDRKSTRLNSSHIQKSRMPSSA